MDDFKVPFAGYSALFRAVNNSMFINDKLSNRIVWMNEDKTGENLEIFNEERLKTILFDEIKLLYNDRINSHELLLTRLGENDINNFSIERFKLVDDNDRSISGLYEVFPKTFRCEKCDDFRIFSNDEEWENLTLTTAEFLDVRVLILKCLSLDFVKPAVKYHQYSIIVIVMVMNI